MNFLSRPKAPSKPTKAITHDAIFVLALCVLVALLLFNATQSFVIEYVASSNSSAKTLLKDENLPASRVPIDLGSMQATAGFAALEINLDFQIFPSSGYQNLFQTDTLNRGVRLERSGGTLALIVGRSTDSAGFRFVKIPAKVSADNWHHLRVLLVGNTYVRIEIDKTRTFIPIARKSFSLNDIKIGIGYDNQSRFQGEMKNINVITWNTPFPLAVLSVANTQLPWLFFILTIVLLQRTLTCYPPFQGDRRRFNKLQTQTSLMLRSAVTLAMYLSTLLVLNAVLLMFLDRHFEKSSEAVRTSLLPGFGLLDGATPYNSTLVLFILVEVSLIGTLAIFWSLRTIGLPGTSISRSRTILLCNMLVSLVLFASIPAPLPRILLACCAFAPTILLLPRFVEIFPPAMTVNAISATRHFSIALRRSTTVFAGVDDFTRRVLFRGSSSLSTLAKRTFMVLASGAICYFIALPVFQAWDPIGIPNDYMESRDLVRFQGPKGDVVAPRDEAAQCLNDLESLGAVKSPEPNFAAERDCSKFDGLSEIVRTQLETSIRNTAGWQGEVGRTLFHHSYMFNPIRHFLTFGFDRSTPYLYGYGNTLFHAALVWADGGASLSSYFATFPMAEFVGIVAIAALVLQITRNGWLTLSAFALSLTAFYSISYVPVFLAASFSPLRYFGLLLQLASICACCRSTRSASYLLLPLAATASQFWNSEFAMFGLTGQILLLLAPTTHLTLKTRSLILGLLLLCPLYLGYFSRTSPDIINTVQLSFYNVGMPFMTRTDTVRFFLYVLMAQTLLFGLSMLFTSRERTLRLSFTPVLALLLVKYIFNPASPHLYLVYAILWPVLLIYLPQTDLGNRSLFRRNAMRFTAPLILIAGVLCAARAGSDYKAQATSFRSVVVDDFKTAAWSKLGESIKFVAPEAAIYERVESIRQHMTDEDTLLVLSPYDHILNFYLNPRTVCGHFDLMSNLATRDIETSMIDCARRSSKILIVYDNMAETNCPTDPLQVSFRCDIRTAAKSNLTMLRDKLLPYTRLIASDRDLSFYRPRSPGQTSD